MPLMLQETPLLLLERFDNLFQLEPKLLSFSSVHLCTCCNIIGAFKCKCTLYALYVIVVLVCGFAEVYKKMRPVFLVVLEMCMEIFFYDCRS